ncbi:hypothetical protein BSL82_14070 [Tardibacter chloracetimidivorans]|uniref:Uncharacterized protein n=1 Tax=Tardibacter chloracetimidivorans TaxID=1921510 RepID=A0A1L3ZXD3_9SPHN|nr:hypothetical protein BSL82_14070 [Tardibacter chloracetimidivorans]
MFDSFLACSRPFGGGACRAFENFKSWPTLVERQFESMSLAGLAIEQQDHVASLRIDTTVDWGAKLRRSDSAGTVVCVPIAGDFLSILHVVHWIIQSSCGFAMMQYRPLLQSM